MGVDIITTALEVVTISVVKQSGREGIHLSNQGGEVGAGARSNVLAIDEKPLQGAGKIIGTPIPLLVSLSQTYSSLVGQLVKKCVAMNVEILDLFSVGLSANYAVSVGQ